MLREALGFYERSLKIDPDFPEGWLNSGALFSRLKNRKKAIYCYHKVLEFCNDPRARYNLALEHFKAGEHTQALEVLGEKEGESNLAMDLLSAYCYGKTGQYSRSEKLLLSIMERDQGNKAACVALVLLYGKIGDHKECRRYLVLLRQLDPKNPLLDRDETIFQQEESPRISQILLFRKSAAFDPELDELKNSLATPANQSLNKSMEEKSRQLASKNEKSGKDYFDLSLLSIMKGDGEEAMDYLLSAIGS